MKAPPNTSLKKQIASSIAILAISSLICSCNSKKTVTSDHVNEDQLWGEYKADYNAFQSEGMEFYVQYRQGGSAGHTIRLDAPARIDVDGQPMAMVDGDRKLRNPILAVLSNGTSYYLNKPPGPPAKSYTITWTRSDKSTYANSLIIPEKASIQKPVDGAVFTKGTSLSVTLAGDPLKKGETATAHIRGPGQWHGEPVDGIRPASKSISKSITAGTEIVFTKETMDQFGSGIARITVNRKISAKVQQGHESVGGKLVSTYHFLPVSISIADPPVE